MGVETRSEAVVNEIHEIRARSEERDARITAQEQRFERIETMMAAMSAAIERMSQAWGSRRNDDEAESSRGRRPSDERRMPPPGADPMPRHPPNPQDRNGDRPEPREQPNMLVVDMEKFVSPQEEPWFSVNEKEPLAYALVEVIEAADMKPSDLNGLADPYVKGQLGPYRFMTKIHKKTLSPKWHEEFKFPISTWESPNTLCIEVRDKDHFVDDTLGDCSVNITEFRGGQRNDMWLPLQKIKMGRLHLTITVIDSQDKATDQLSEDETVNEDYEGNSLNDQNKTTREGSILSRAASDKSPRVANKFEPIDIEGQDETGHMNDVIAKYRDFKHRILFPVEMLEPFLNPALTPLKNMIPFGNVSSVFQEMQEYNCEVALKIIYKAVRKPAVLPSLEKEWRRGSVAPSVLLAILEPHMELPSEIDCCKHSGSELECFPVSNIPGGASSKSNSQDDADGKTDISVTAVKIDVPEDVALYFAPSELNSISLSSLTGSPTHKNLDAKDDNGDAVENAIQKDLDKVTQNGFVLESSSLSLDWSNLHLDHIQLMNFRDCELRASGFRSLALDLHSEPGITSRSHNAAIDALLLATECYVNPFFMTSFRENKKFANVKNNQPNIAGNFEFAEQGRILEKNGNFLETVAQLESQRDKIVLQILLEAAELDAKYQKTAEDDQTCPLYTEKNEELISLSQHDVLSLDASTRVSMIEGKELQSIVKRGINSALLCVQMRSQVEGHLGSITASIPASLGHDKLQQLLEEFQDLFEESKVLPPLKSKTHRLRKFEDLFLEPEALPPGIYKNPHLPIYEIRMLKHRWRYWMRRMTIECRKMNWSWELLLFEVEQELKGKLMLRIKRKG